MRLPLRSVNESRRDYAREFPSGISRARIASVHNKRSIRRFDRCDPHATFENPQSVEADSKAAPRSKSPLEIEARSEKKDFTAIKDERRKEGRETAPSLVAEENRGEKEEKSSNAYEARIMPPSSWGRGI